MHANAYNFVERIASRGLPSGPVIEIGGRNINGSIRQLFGPAYLSLDLYDGPGVDIVANGATYRPKIRPVVVVCCEVLEHAEDAEQICANAYRMLLPGGVFIVTAATEGRFEHSAHDGGNLREGEFYRNVTAKDLARWLRNFARVEFDTNPMTCDIYAFAQKGTR